MSFARRISKFARGMTSGPTRKALWHRVTPSYEHEALLAGLGRLQTIVDVGANVGQFALLSRIVQPQARVISFEPIPSAAARFRAVLGRDDMVTLHETALGETAGTAEIHITARADSSSLLKPKRQAEVFPGTHEVGTQTITVSRLDEALCPNAIVGPSLLKIDVQGFEGAVLEGCAALLPRFDWIYCELSFIELYSGQPLAHDLIAWLSARGFRLDGVGTDPSMWRNGRAVQADFLFSKKEAGQ